VRQLGVTSSGLEIVSCAICDSDEWRTRFRKAGTEIVECRRCGLVFVNPRYSWEVVKKRYSPDYFTQEYLPAQGVIDGRIDMDQVDGRHGALLCLIEGQAGSKGRLFDVGAAGGLFLAAAKRRGWTVEGIEYSEEAVRFANDRLGVEVRQGMANDISPTAGPFDVVTMFDVIEHLVDPLDVLRRIRSVLRSGGLLVVTTPNVDALSRYALGTQWSILSPLEHLYHFSDLTLQKALQRAGFAEPVVHRVHEGWDVFDTMNPRSTHQPGSSRARAYLAFVGTLGPSLRSLVQTTGKGDILLATAGVQ
jgi:2-polyprenyl-3-methyl-5-hydroxy-6-metoxy-1,4-benzoquinol methylase